MNGYPWGSIPLIMYPAGGEFPPVPPVEFLLITDLTFFLLSDNTEMELAN